MALVASDFSLLGALSFTLLYFTLLVYPLVLILITRQHTVHVVCCIFTTFLSPLISFYLMILAAFPLFPPLLSLFLLLFSSFFSFLFFPLLSPPQFLPRVKEDVEKSLPPKEEIIIEVALTTIQKQFYRAVYERNTTFLFKGSILMFVLGAPFLSH